MRSLATRSTGPGSSPVTRLVLAVALAYASLGVLGLFGSDRLIFLPPPAQYADRDGIIKLTTAAGRRISAVHLANPTAEFTLLYSHGNAEDLGLIAPVLRLLHGLGFAVLAYDYAGYGTSEGRPSERATYEDIDAAYAYLTRTLHVPAERIIAHGRSLGAAPSVDLAARVPLGGLVLESPFLTAYRVMTRVPLLPFDKFRNVSKIGHVRCPLLIMHGAADEVIPVYHGRKLFEAAPEPKRLVEIEGAGHNDFILVAGPRYGETLRSFAALVRQLQAAPRG